MQFTKDVQCPYCEIVSDLALEPREMLTPYQLGRVARMEELKEASAWIQQVTRMSMSEATELAAQLMGLPT